MEDLRANYCRFSPNDFSKYLVKCFTSPSFIMTIASASGKVLILDVWRKRYIVKPERINYNFHPHSNGKTKTSIPKSRKGMNPTTLDNHTENVVHHPMNNIITLYTLPLHAHDCIKITYNDLLKILQTI